VIRFGAAHNGILIDGAPIILAALQLQTSADRFANVPLPAGVLTNTGQEIGEDDAAAIVTAFDTARESGATAFLQSMTYERTQLNAADLQLVESVAAMDTRLARLLNVPVSMVAASPTGSAHAQLYANVPQNLTQLVQQAVAPYLVCLEDAITFQATPRGQNVVFNTSDWLRFAQVSMPNTQPAGTPPLTPEGTPQ
jgi:phage portal protein BeeE